MAVCQHGCVISVRLSEGAWTSEQGARALPSPHLGLRDASFRKVQQLSREEDKMPSLVKGCLMMEGCGGKNSAAAPRMPAGPHLVSLFSHWVPVSPFSCCKTFSLRQHLQSSLSCMVPLELMWGAIWGSERESNVVRVTQQVSGEWQRWGPLPALSVSADPFLLLNLSVVGWMVTTSKVYVYPQFQSAPPAFLRGIKVFADALKVRISKWDYPGSGWA